MTRPRLLLIPLVTELSNDAQGQRPAIAFSSVTPVFRFFRDHYRAITLVSGVILIAMGVLLYTNELTQLNIWLQDAGVNAISDL